MKYQWKTKATRERWADIDKQAKKGRYTDFLLLSYEHLFIFRKLDKDEDLSELKSSMTVCDK